MPIFDQGYQHWQGELSGHGWRCLAVTRHGIRAGMKNKMLRMLLLGALVPALMLAGVISLWGLVEHKNQFAISMLRAMGPELINSPTDFRATAWALCYHFFLNVEMWFIMIVVLLVGPSLISQDLRYNALPLYFSRPVRRTDYFVGKLGVIAFFLGLVTVAPAVLAWVLGLMFSLDFRAVIDTSRLLMGVVSFGVVVSLSAGLFILALSSLSRNSRFVVAFWGGMWLVTSFVALIMVIFHEQSMMRNTFPDEWYVKMRDKFDLLMELRQQQQFPQFGDAFNRPEFDKNQMQNQWQNAEKMKREEKKKLRKATPEKRKEKIDELTKELEDFREETKKLYEEPEVQWNVDWRPIISYTSDLQRVGYALIGSQQAWDKLEELTRFAKRMQAHQPRNVNRQGEDYFEYWNRRPQVGLATHMVGQYPWIWSAMVLLGVGGLSCWILHKRVTSLDQLR
jgi:ABC-2 type transport system permease protein